MGANAKTRTQEEIDIVADADEKAIFGECKWMNAQMSLDAFTELQRKSMLFERYSNKSFILFSKASFYKVLKDHSSKDEVNLIDLETLYKPDKYCYTCITSLTDC